MTSRRAWLAGAAGAIAASNTIASLLFGQEPASDSKRLIVRSADPMNGEPPLSELVDSFVTPLPSFYIRSHGDHPRIDVGEFRLAVTGMVDRELSLSLAELADDFPRREVLATLICAGNRRNEHSRTRQVSGVSWDAGAIGTARWCGAALKDILLRAGPHDNARHVWFEGLDHVAHGNGTIPFGGSIPLRKAMAGPPNTPEALVAYQMNGQPLTIEHGFPARTVVPGYIGARSVKWLGKIVVSDQPSPNHFLADAYKLIAEETEEAVRKALPLYEFRLNSAICLPAINAQLASRRVLARGYALPDGTNAGNQVTRVEVSNDGGARWYEAQFLDPAHPFCWRRWEVKLPIEKGTREILVRATGQDGVVQPKESPWNVKGYMYDAWHRVPVRGVM